MMNKKGDSSQTSGISGVSTINSCSSTSHAPQSASKQVNVDRVINDITECENTIGELAKLRIIEEALEHVANDEDLLPPETAEKLRKIILARTVDKYKKLSVDVGDDIKTQLLGITDFQAPELTIDEKKLVKSAVEKEAQASCQRFISKYEELGGNVKEAMEKNKSLARKNLSKIQEFNLSHWKEKLSEVCNEYQRDVVKLAELLDEWKRLKYEDVEELNVKKSETKLLQAQIAEVQAKITKISCCIKMFKETPTTVDAFKIINQELDEKIANVEGEIKKKKVLKKQYEDLQGTEYDEILKRYLDLCATIKKEERLLEML